MFLKTADFGRMRPKDRNGLRASLKSSCNIFPEHFAVTCYSWWNVTVKLPQKESLLSPAVTFLSCNIKKLGKCIFLCYWTENVTFCCNISSSKLILFIFLHRESLCYFLDIYLSVIHIHFIIIISSSSCTLIRPSCCPETCSPQSTCRTQLRSWSVTGLLIWAWLHVVVYRRGDCANHGGCWSGVTGCCRVSNVRDSCVGVEKPTSIIDDCISIAFSHLN